MRARLPTRALLALALPALVAAGATTTGCDRSRAGHDRMVATLKSIADRTDEDNLWLGDATARKRRARLAAMPANAPVAERLRLLVDLSNEELRLGNAEAAIGLLQEAQGLAVQLGPGGGDTAVEVTYRLGVTWLYLAENENSRAHPLPGSCIVPMADAHHTLTRGSTAAMAQFREVLRVEKVNSTRYLKARWLLNIAAMTLGEWPDGLAPSELLQQWVFDSGAEIPRFEQAARELGVDTYDLAGGAICDDLDGDGVLDLLVSTSDTRGPMRFFHGDGKGGFEDRTKEAGLDVQFGGLSMTDADYDNDGDVDVYVLRGGWFGASGRHPNSLLRNDGAGHFTDVTYDAGLGALSFPTQAGAWGDYDNDGDLDLYVGSETSPENSEVNQLFRNEGDGTFTDVAAAAGVADANYTKAVSWGDYDGDNRPDLYVSNMAAPNRLFHNNGDGTFTDVAPQAGVTGPIDSFPAWFFDYDNDGNLDIYVPWYRGSTDQLARVVASAMRLPLPGAERPKLYRGDGHGGFRDVAAECGLDRLSLPMGSNFGDLNLDGWPDIYLGTGYPDYEALMMNVMYLNQGGRRFADVTWSGGFGHLQKGHAVLFADLDGDGDMDVFEELGGALPGDKFHDGFFRNPGFTGHFLTVQLVGRRSNRSAIGARLRADFVEDGKPRSVFRHVNTGGSFGCNPLRQMLGLGKATRVDRLEVLWPTTGAVQVFTGIDAGQAIRIVEDAKEWEPLAR